MINEVLLNCISAFLKGEKLTAELSNEQWQELIEKAAQQKVITMVYETLGDVMPAAIKRDCKSTALYSISVQLRTNAEFLSVYKELSAAGIMPLVVKGIICRSTYDKPEYRISGDEDLYIPFAQYPAFHEKMLELGFKAKEPDYKNAHEERYTRNGLLVEGHWELFPQENSALNAFNSYTELFWSRAERRQLEGIEMLTLEPTDHMIFLLLHTFKHFVNSGVGVRQMCDVAQWAKAYEIDWQRVIEVMSAANAEYFCAAVFDAASNYFGMALPKDWVRADSTALLADALDGGIYGSSDMSRKHSGSITLGAIEAAKDEKISAPILASLFPNRAVMELSYPWVKKSSALLPIAWGARIIKYLGQQGSGNSAAESLKIGNERIELLKQYKII